MVVPPSALTGLGLRPPPTPPLMPVEQPARSDWTVTIAPLQATTEPVIAAGCSCGFAPGTYSGELAIYRAASHMDDHVRTQHLGLR
jgi:hypothetical protein